MSVGQPSPWTGRCFVHPAFDYLLIGGGLSLLVIPCVYLVTGGVTMMDFAALPWLILCSNSAHFAASTVRLYSKEGTRESLPFVTRILPLATIVTLTLTLALAEYIGRYVQALYLSWSPYHYSAQAYGLAVMYCYRSGATLTVGQKRTMFLVALLPFFKVLCFSGSKHFIPWLAPPEFVWGEFDWKGLLEIAGQVIGVASVVLPLLLFVALRKSGPVPVISLLIIMTNACWFVVFPVIEGFLWATIFHGVQYLAIVMIFHVREGLNRPHNKSGPVAHAAKFYLLCLALGYALFNCLPPGYEAMGFGSAESLLMVIAAINIHHFIVDAFIWKLGRGDINQRTVDADGAASRNA